MRYQVKVVVPIYTTELSEIEATSFAHNMKVLSCYPRVIIKPKSLDVSEFMSTFPDIEVLSVSDEWLGKKNGIAGYNIMMTSADFYDTFSDTDYILICQTDAWIFRDELEEWCKKDYDYVAAPWPKRPIYNIFPVKQYLWVRKRLFGNHLNILRQNMFGKIGNGGLSLRKIESFRKACREYTYEIDYFSKRKHHLYHEDVFWALIPKYFKYPTVEEALGFSFDVKPEFCYKLSGNRIPFGCHGFTYPKIYNFWKDIIPIDKNGLQK